MSERNLVKIAIQHFLKFGYEGTKLSHIAQESGMKKQSLYFHFKDKDDLFLQVNKIVIEEEINFLQYFFDRNATLPLKDTLYSLLLEYKSRYLDNDNNGFMFLLTFIPPAHLQNHFLQNYHLFLTHLKNSLKPKFREEPDLRINPDEGPASFITLLDGLLIQLIFETPKDFDNSLRIFWDIYWHGIIKKK
ncbi:MAG TPA: TetR/AcrR family transcriptional regulator [Methylomusa anaerophila]|uniref:DNA-binding transcriptional repressor AcrR n=1 Tax=Methylomusa anaerophila TaxID=1930071 RepID=A0A348AQJ5_9FIRM|nr:TetR/AcrR family transcriptional regulator [Methylomusa anaerophila]BBB93343.1 DNA-binding transcriptional repressor AcrR [Methylomusa anaerophila]HML86827.1 TetR/AcrR family transcriptional regulator [Methylomusa anaerophila]